MKDRILVIEDSRDTQFIISYLLTSDSIEVDSVSTVKEAMSKIKNNDVDLVILDLGLPDGDGFTVLEHLKTASGTFEVPVMLLTGRTETDDKVRAFSLGAEDYVVKPFDPQELQARVCSKLAKAKRREVRQDVITMGCFKLHLPLLRAYIMEDGQETDLHLTPSEFRIFFHLMSHEDKAFSGDELLEVIREKDVHIVRHNVYSHIYGLRKKMGRHAHWLKSLAGGGYTLTTSD